MKATKTPDGCTGAASNLTVLQSFVLVAVRDTPKSGRQLCSEVLPDFSECTETDIWIALGQLRSMGLVRDEESFVVNADGIFAGVCWCPTSAGLALLDAA